MMDSNTTNSTGGDDRGHTPRAAQKMPAASIAADVQEVGHDQSVDQGKALPIVNAGEVTFSATHGPFLTNDPGASFETTCAMPAVGTNAGDSGKAGASINDPDGAFATLMHGELLYINT